jgi:hypothetical protein
MKHFSREQFETLKLGYDAGTMIKNCIDRLHEDQKHTVDQSRVGGLTFEDLLATLLAARAEIESIRGVA